MLLLILNGQVIDLNVFLICNLGSFLRCVMNINAMKSYKMSKKPCCSRLKSSQRTAQDDKKVNECFL